jgi:hypothetical protein
MTRLVTALAVVLLAALGDSAFAFPTGIVSLPPPCVVAPSDVLNNPYVSIIGVRCGWLAVEKSDAIFNWSSVDSQITAARGVGKPVLLRLTAGGANTPSWVFASGVQTFTFTNSNPYSQLYKKQVTIPVFWDPILLKKKLALISAMGAHFASNPSIHLVAIACANALTDDWFVPQTSQDVANWKAVGYTSSKLITACEQTIDATMAAFPTQYSLLAVNPNGSLDSTPNYVSQQVISYALSKYPTRFIVQKNVLSAVTPNPTQAAKLFNWQVLYNAEPNVAGQNLWYVTNDSTCRMNGGTSPCPPNTILTRALTIGHNYGMNYVEVYGQDIENQGLQSVLSQFATAP